MDVIGKETAFRAHCKNCGDTFEMPFLDLRPMLGGALPTPQALATSLTCVCSLNSECARANYSASLWR